MPYITQAHKDAIHNGAAPGNAGELNYCFTRLALNYIKAKGEKYQHYNDVIGALEAAKLELYRRRVAPYEDVKIIENGDVR